MARPNVVIPALRKRASFAETSQEVMAELYRNRTQAEVAEILGVSQGAVCSNMKRLRLSARTKRTPAPKGRVAIELTRRGRTTGKSARQMFLSLYRTQGKSLKEIGNLLGVSLTTVRQFAVDRNIPLRSAGRPRSN